jgi:hypothetical protein
MKIVFSGQIFKNILLLNYMDVCAEGVELSHEDWQTDGRTDMNKLIVAFRNFAKAPKNICSYRTNSNSVSFSLWALYIVPC